MTGKNLDSRINNSLPIAREGFPFIGAGAGVTLLAVLLGLVVPAVFFGLLTLPELIAGFGIYHRREWGRIVGLAVAFLNLISFPIGTALSVYSLVILFHRDTVPLFKEE